MAQAHILAAVIGGLVAEHVEEEPVDIVLIEPFGEYLHGLLPVIAAVDTGRIEPVVDYRTAIRLAEEPLGVGVIDRLLRLAEIVAADHPDVAGVRLAQRVAKHVAAGLQIRAWIVKFHLGRIVSGDAAHAREYHVGVHGGQRLHLPARVRGGVGFAQIGLHQADRLGHPPARLSLERHSKQKE